MASVAVSRDSASRPPRSLISLMAATFSSSLRSELRMAEARASSICALTPASASPAMAASRAVSCEASEFLKIVSAAWRRVAVSGDCRVRLPSESRIMRRRPLLTLIFTTSVFAASPASLPVTGSISTTPAPPSLVMKIALSDLRTWRFPSASAVSAGLTRGSPRAARSFTIFSISGKPLAVASWAIEVRISASPDHASDAEAKQESSTNTMIFSARMAPAIMT